MTDLTSNGFPLVNSPDQLGWLVGSSPTAPIEELRVQLKTQGYLWLRGFFPRHEVLALRQRFFERMQPTGILAENTPAVEGIFSGRRTPQGVG